jgi:riboflavin kinase/FMN adenylyltransferase
MNVIHTAAELNAGSRKVCMTLGVFDGVHLGHQRIIRKTIADARLHEAISLVATFDRHPNAVVAPDRVAPLIYSLPQKVRAIEALGPDAFLLLQFDLALSRQSGEAFVRLLAHALGRLHSFCVGTDFTFGHKRSGDVPLLKRLGEELGFSVAGIDSVLLDGRTISSTRIREAIRSGDLDLASRMLGRPYSLAARVVPGDRLGAKLGFPTANLDTAGMALPPGGVYAARAIARGKTCRAVANIGHRPTLKLHNPPLRVEVHLLDTDAELYGEEVEIVFLEKLRDEKQFASVDALKAQIARDVDSVRSRP